MTVENLSGRRVQHLLRPVGFNSQSTAGYISYPGKCHSNVIRCFKCFKCNFFQCFIDRFWRGEGMLWKFLKRRGKCPRMWWGRVKKCPMTGRTLKCFVNDCCALCWHNFIFFDLMIIFKSFISATSLKLLLTDPRPDLQNDKKPVRVICNLVGGLCFDAQLEPDGECSVLETKVWNKVK